MSSVAAWLKTLGPAGVFLLAVLDSAGIPLPTGVDLMLILTAITNPRLGWQSAALAIFGSAIGCMILFFIARKGGRVYLERHAHSPRAMRFRRWFDRYGLLTVFIPVLVPIPLPVKVFVLSAGALGVRPRSFLLTVLAGRIPRYLGLAYLGMELGENSLPWLKAHTLHLTTIAVALFVGLYIAIRIKGARAVAVE
ncbi:MAG: TVP38/TMEM64 family protein [Bryobacterales bacterium]|nr:TVP38/TMEM64 family protein [Bryobacterales bacterium]